MINCDNVTVSYSKTEVLHNVTLTAKSGEITVLLGKNGCGKTTLIRALNGYIPYKGNIRIDGIENRTLSAAKRAGIVSVMPQMLNSPQVTVRELVSFGRQPYTGISGILSHNDMMIVESVLEKTGLSSIADKNLNCISGGEKQKAYFAMLLSQNAPNLLLDEPSSHLDAAHIGQIMEFLRVEKSKGKTILAVLHDINSAICIADRIVVLHSGRVIFDGNRDGFCSETIAEDVFGMKKYLCCDTKDSNKTGYCYINSI